MASFLNNRARRALSLAAAAILLATVVEPPPPSPPAPPARSAVGAAPVNLDENDPSRRRAGSLTFVRGWHLTSDEDRFGGISAIHVEGDRVTAISDAGVLLHFALPERPGTQPLAVRPLPHDALSDKASHDSEAMLVHGGRIWIAFERRNAVARYGRADLRLERSARPAPMRDWRGNSGPEAMVRLADGRFLVFAEGRDNDDPFSPVVLLDGDPAEPATRATELRYRRQPGFRVTDAALLPDGRLLILNRRLGLFSGVAARLVVAEATGLRAGATIEGRPVAELAPPLTVDNMEALSVSREGGRTIVRIASDDNFMELQRTLLLEFLLEERAP